LFQGIAAVNKSGSDLFKIVIGEPWSGSYTHLQEAPGTEQIMTPEERHAKIEAEIEKHNMAIQGLIVVGRTCLDSIKEMREAHARDYQELRKAQAATGDKLNILIDTVDRIIRNRNRDQ
jgi:hypothetical protein